MPSRTASPMPTRASGRAVGARRRRTTRTFGAARDWWNAARLRYRSGYLEGFRMVTPRLAQCCIGLGLLVAALLAPISSASAQNYPARRVTLVVPYTPGSGFDIVARTVGQKLSERWGQPVIVDNKAGASGTIGTEAVANSAPDGYTLLVSGGPHTVYPSLMKNLRFDSIASFTPVGVTAAGVVALVVNPQALPVNSVDELIKELRAQPGKYNFSSPGVGTLQHLGMELFKQQLKLDVLHVPYRGAGPAITDLITGQVQFTYLPVNSALPQVQAGKLRMLAVASSSAPRSRPRCRA